jgi:hypothetical protein
MRAETPSTAASQVAWIFVIETSFVVIAVLSSDSAPAKVQGRARQ